MTGPTELREQLDAAIEVTAAETSFSGVVRIDLPDTDAIEHAFGLADRRFGIALHADTPMSIASGTKGFTALVVMALAEAGELRLDQPARDLLGTDLPLIDDRVTIEHLIAHRSGIGDYLDEAELGDISEHAMAVPVHQLDSAESYLQVLDGFPQVSEPGERFAYNNSGFVATALLAERAAGRPYAELVAELVCRPAGMTATAFHRSDALPAGVATGYLEAEGLRTNSLHLPVLGSGDGGLFSTVADMRRFWTALFDGRIVSAEAAAKMTQVHSPSTGESATGYGLGFWLPSRAHGVRLVGYDAGVSFTSSHTAATATTQTVISNTSEGAWGMTRALDAVIDPAP